MIDVVQLRGDQRDAVTRVMSTLWWAMVGARLGYVGGWERGVLVSCQNQESLLSPVWWGEGGYGSGGERKGGARGERAR